MTTVESFQVLAAVAGAAGVVALLVPGLRGTTAVARHAGAAAALVATWFLMIGSLVSRDDVSALRDRVDSPARIGALALGVLAAITISLLAVRIVIRRPALWLVLLGITLPIRVPISLGGDQSGNLLLPLYWAIGVGLVAYVWAARTGRVRHVDRSTAIDLPLAAFTAYTLASTWWSADIHEATVKAAFFYVPFVLLFRLVVLWWPLVDRPVRALGHTAVAVAAVTALVAVGQYATRRIWWNDTLIQANVYNRFFRANGIFYDPNILGRYLMLALIVVMVYAVVSRSSGERAVLTVVGAVLAGGLVVTFSRSSALGLMVATALIAARAFGVKKTVLTGVAALVLIGGPVIAVNSHVRAKATSVDKLLASGEGRVRLVRGGVDLWKTAPVRGVGLGAFSDSYRETLTRRQKAKTRVVISHTAPVTVLAELGAVGFGLFAALCISVLIALWRAARAARPHGWLPWTALTALVAIFVHALLYSALFEDPYVWVLMAIGLTGLSAATAAVQVTERGATRPMPIAGDATGA